LKGLPICFCGYHRSAAGMQYDRTNGPPYRSATAPGPAATTLRRSLVPVCPVEKGGQSRLPRWKQPPFAISWISS
jgi:hypothetical protein